MQQASSFDMSEHSTRVESKIVVALERVSQAFRVLLWQESGANQLSPIQIQVLIFLLFHSGKQCKVGYLANEFNMTKATISVSVKLLVQKKLVERVADTDDTRSFCLELTKAGETVARKVSAFTGFIEEPIRHFSESQKETLLLSLLQLIQKLYEAEVITAQRMCLSCRFYKPRKGTHHCILLNRQLSNRQLAVDCPEHQLAS